MSTTWCEGRYMYRGNYHKFCNTLVGVNTTCRGHFRCKLYVNYIEIVSIETSICFLHHFFIDFDYIHSVNISSINYSIAQCTQILVLFKYRVSAVEVIIIIEISKSFLYCLRKKAWTQRYNSAVFFILKNKYIIDVSCTNCSKKMLKTVKLNILKKVRKNRAKRKKITQQLTVDAELSFMMIWWILKKHSLSKRKFSYKSDLMNTM